MIPKIIHYCWFGKGEKPKKIKECIESWKTILTDYQIIEWNEKNFNYNELLYAKDAYEARKYAFVSDVARVKALYEYGGIYLDTDVIVYKSFDRFLNHKCVLGFEEGQYIATSFMACEKNFSLMKEFYELYQHSSFYDERGQIISGTNVTKLTNLLLDYGLIRNNQYQELNNHIAIYPQDYFSPYDYGNCIKQNTNNTICEHLFLVSWMSKKEHLKKMLKKVIVTLFGKKTLIRMRKMFKQKSVKEYKK